MSLRPGTLLLVLLAVGTSQSVDVDSLSVGTSQSFTENWLTSIMDTLLREYRFTGQFCLMVNIPATTQPQQLLNVLTNDRYQNVLNVIGTREDDGSRVYVGSNVIVARPNLEGHAEQRAMQQIELLHQNQQQTGRVFLMYSFLSPCGDHCATMEGDNILEPFQDQVMTHWSRGQYILVFNRVFDNPGSGRRPTEQELKKPLEQLKAAEFRNIFRCFGPSGSFKCHECFTGNQLNNVCINNSASPGGQGGSNPTGGQGSSSNIFGQGQGSRTQGQGGNSPTGGQGDRQAKRPRKT